MTYFVNADWSAIVPEGSSEAAFGVQAKDLKRLGLAHLVKGELPEQAPEPEVLRNVPDEPEAKEAEAPANKKAPAPANK